MNISVIIPTLNEAHAIGASLSDLMGIHDKSEVIVADGGSSDETADIVRRFPLVKLVTSERGRGRQMNEGARAASGEILMFLHADTCLPRDAFQRVEEKISDPSVVAGSFCLSFDVHNFVLDMYAFFSRINHILFTYGDQCLFIRTGTFNAIGGFQNIPIMEDVEIQERLRRAGRFLKIRTPAVTSARRFMQNGILRQQALNAFLVLLYNIGFPPSLLKRCY